MLRLFRLWRVGGQDLRLLWFALRHSRRPAWLLPATAALGLFAVDPLNFAMPVLGFVDELVLFPLILHGIVRFLPADILSGFAGGRSRYSSKIAR